MDEKGPWALALGVLAVGAAAFAAELRRRRRTDTVVDEQGGDETG
ncbi:hypothetical protein [Halomicrococcus gelatinilyticus]